MKKECIQSCLQEYKILIKQEKSNVEDIKKEIHELCDILLNLKFHMRRFTDFYDHKKLGNIDVPKKITKILPSSKKIGTLSVYYDGEEVKTVSLFLKNDMHFSFLRFITNIVLPFSLLALIVVVALKIPKIIRK